MSAWSLPKAGDIIVDSDGKRWTVLLDNGFQLRDEDMNLRPDFKDPMTWLEFARWFNLQ